MNLYGVLPRKLLQRIPYLHNRVYKIYTRPYSLRGLTANL